MITIVHAECNTAIYRGDELVLCEMEVTAFDALAALARNSTCISVVRECRLREDAVCRDGWDIFEGMPPKLSSLEGCLE